MPSPTMTCARVVPGVAGDVGQEFLRQADHLAVDFHHHRALHAFVLQDAAQHAAVAGADDQDIGGLAMRQQRHMGQHLLIYELIALGDLDDAVQHHDAAVGEAFEDDDVLELAFDPGEFALHQEALAPVGVKRFVDPAIGGHATAPEIRTARDSAPGRVSRQREET